MKKQIMVSGQAGLLQGEDGWRRGAEQRSEGCLSTCLIDVIQMHEFFSVSVLGTGLMVRYDLQTNQLSVSECTHGCYVANWTIPRLVICTDCKLKYHL